MEIPVRMINTKTTSFCGNNKTTLVEEREIKPVVMTSFSGRPLVEECDVKVIQNKWNQTSQLEHTLFNQEQTLKHWFTTVQFDECLLRKCCTENFNCIVSKVDPILRVVVIKCLKQKLSTSLVTPVKRIICLPKHVDFRNVKVTICKERKVIIVKAPIHYTPEFDSEREFCTEYEPTIYKVLKHLRRNCPRFMVPRYMRDVETGMHKIYLDVHCSGFLPEELKMTLKNTERLLTFKAFRQLQTEMWQQRMGFFPRYLRHELTLPTWIHLDKITSFKLNNEVLRVHLPIIKLPTLEEIKLCSYKKSGIYQKEFF